MRKLNKKSHEIVHIDESDRGLCYYCGRPASIKIGLWSDLAESDAKQSWRAVLICSNCNDKHRVVDEEAFSDTYLGY